MSAQQRNTLSCVRGGGRGSGCRCGCGCGCGLEWVGGGSPARRGAPATVPRLARWNLFDRRGGNDRSAGRLIESHGPFDIMGFQECDSVGRVLSDARLRESHVGLQGPRALGIAYAKDVWDFLGDGRHDVAEDRPEQHYGARCVCDTGSASMDFKRSTTEGVVGRRAQVALFYDTFRERRGRFGCGGSVQSPARGACVIGELACCSGGEAPAPSSSGGGAGWLPRRRGSNPPAASYRSPPRLRRRC